MAESPKENAEISTQQLTEFAHHVAEKLQIPKDHTFIRAMQVPYDDARQSALNYAAESLFSALPTQEQVRKLYLLFLSGEEEHFSSLNFEDVDHNGGHNTPEGKRKEQRIREQIIDALYHAQMESLIQRRAEIQRRIDALNGEISTLKALNKGIDREIQDLQEELRRFEAHEKKHEKELKELQKKVDVHDREIDQAINSYAAALESDPRFAALKDNVHTIESLEDRYVTIEYKIPGLKGNPMRHVLIEDEEGNYYVKNPVDGEHVYLDLSDETTRFALIGALERREDGRTLARESNTNHMEHVTQFIQIYDRLNAGLDAHPELCDSRLALLRLMHERDLINGQLVEAREKMEEIQSTIENLEGQLETLRKTKTANDAKIEKLEIRLQEEYAEDAKLEKEIEEIEDRYEVYRNISEANILTMKTIFGKGKNGFLNDDEGGLSEKLRNIFHKHSGHTRTYTHEHEHGHAHGQHDTSADFAKAVTAHMQQEKPEDNPPDPPGGRNTQPHGTKL